MARKHRWVVEMPSRTLIMILLVSSPLSTACREDPAKEEAPSGQTEVASAPVPAGPPPVALSQADDVTPPYPIERVEADLSHCEGRLREPGYPIVRVVVDEIGYVRKAEALNPTGSCVQEAFVEAVKQWRFQPAMRNGQPTLVEFNVAMSANP